MAGTAVATKTKTVAEPEVLESILDDLDLDDLPTEIEALDEAVEEVIVDDAEVLEHEELRDLELASVRDEAYEEQESKVDTAASVTETTEAAKSAKTTKVVKAKAAGVPRTPRVDLASMDAFNFILEGDADSMSDADKDAAKTATLALMPKQKKIAEKFENLFQALSAGKLPSVYVVQAFKLLDSKKTMSSADLVAHFKGSYKQGTAMSQAGQILNLFDTVKIATRSKNSLTLNADSVLAARMRNAIAAYEAKKAA
jgi:hypothetical protein